MAHQREGAAQIYPEFTLTLKEQSDTEGWCNTVHVEKEAKVNTEMAVVCVALEYIARAREIDNEHKF